MEPNTQQPPTNPVPQNPVPPSAPAPSSYTQAPTGPNLPVTPVSPPPSTNQSRNNKNLLIMAAVALLLIVFAFLAVMALGNKDKQPQSSSTSSSSEKKENKSFSATRLGDLDQVCQEGAAANTTAYGSGPSPHPIVFFSPSNVSEDRLVEESITFKDRTWRADSAKVDATQLVGCFKRARVGASKKCEFKSGGQPVSVDYYGVTYELTVREAKTGKSVGTKEVNGPNLTCPIVASYNKADPKLYAAPDDGLTETAVREFVVR